MSGPPSDHTPSRRRRSRNGGEVKVALVEPLPTGEQDAGGHIYLAGDIIAYKYSLTSLLGEGGMGAVWLARNLKLDADVAIKLIRRELATLETSARLLQEARAAARLGHRSIVRIFDFGETELDDPFIVMEVLTGESLRAALERKGRLPASNAVITLLPIASALVEAHASGIVHRDLKPDNIMLVPDKSGAIVPKLVDFGIAKFRRAEEPGDEVSSGLVYGTPDYMSPEQAGGREEVDTGTDVWALAVILYEAITGRGPFRAPNHNALIFSIMTEEPTPITDLLAGDAELWQIVQNGLAKQRTARPNMREFGTALARWAVKRGIDSDVTGTSLRAHWLTESTGSALSMAPPPSSGSHGSADEVPLDAGWPGARDGHREAITDAPPDNDVSDPDAGADASPDTDGAQLVASVAVAPAAPRWQRTVWLIAAGLSAAAVLIFALGDPARPATPAALDAASPQPTAYGAPAGPVPVPLAVTTASTEGALPDTSTRPPPSAEASAVAPAKGKPGSRKPRPKRELSIAKQPNF